MESKDKESKNKKNVSQNSFDFSSIMGYPPMGPLSNSFPMLGPNPMFPFFPFPGMASPGDNILPPDGADWWKMASEQAKKFAENMSELYPGMNSMYGGNPFLAPFAQSTGSRISSTPSPSISHHKSLHSTPDGLYNGTKQSSNNSSPAPAKDSGGPHFKAGQRDSRAGSARSTRTRTDSESSTVISPRNPSESSTPVKQSFSSQDQMLKKSSLSSDPSLYSSNPFFFPFGPMGFPGMPFPAASMYGSINDYVPPFNNLFMGSSGLKPSGSGLDNQRLSSSSSSKNSRASQGLYQSSSDFPGASYFGSKHKNDSSDLGRREGSSVIVSKHSFSMPGTAARTLSINDHKLQLGAFKSRQDLADKNKKLKNMMKNSSDFKAMTAESSSPLSSNYFQSESPLTRPYNKLSDRRESSSETVSYSQDGAIDLSVKKPRMESPGPVNPLKSYSSIRQNQPEASNILSALAQSHQMFSKSSSSFSDPLSFNMAAALLPHMYENMFYPSTFAGEMGMSKDVDRKGGGRRGRKRGEQGGKGRGGRSMFISSMMANDVLKDHSLPSSLNDSTFKQGSSNRSYLDHFMMDHRQTPKASQTISSSQELSMKDQKSADRQSSAFQDFFNFDLPPSLRHNELSSDTESSDDASDDWSFGDPLKNQDSRKRKRESPDEKLLRIPLERGWQRETRITGLTSKKMIGQVAYETPTGLRVLTFDDVEKFLQSTQNVELTRRNFSFNANINLGKFFEQRANEKGQSDLISLNEREVAEKFCNFETQRKRSTEKKRMKLACHQMLLQRQQHFQDFQLDTDNKKLDQQDDNKTKDVLKKPQMTQQQQVKPQHLQHQQQQQRDVATTKMQTFMDEKDRKQQLFVKDQQNMMMMFGSGDLQYYSYLLQSSHKHDSMDPHKQGFGLERERRRHYLLLVKAIDARKKEEEKERMREEKRCAKKLDREKKMEQRRMELYLARELKKPMEDRQLQDSKPLPDLDRIPGLKLPGKSFADCLMVLEFAHNFSPNLKLENDMLPTLSTLQDGLLNESSSELFTKFVIHILKLAFDDPGFPNSREAVILSGQKISDIEVNRQNFSELLRVFIRARNGKDDEMAEWLRTKPYYALNSSQKTTILLYICHELLTSKTITNEIEKSIDLISNLKKDKWVIEGKLRKFRMMQAKRLRRSLVVRSQTNEDSNTTTLTFDNNKKDTDDDQSMADSTDEALQNHDSEVEEDQLISPEELESKVDKLTKQYNNLQDKVLSLSYKLSIVPLGQDRYRRLYWVLPKCGGVYIEGMESGEPEEADLTTDASDIPPQLPELTLPALEPLNNDNHSVEPNNASNPPTPISCCSKLNETSDAPDGKSTLPPSEVKLPPDEPVEEASKTNGATSEKISTDSKPKTYDPMTDLTESTITNLEDIIARTVMNSMMEDDVNSPYNDLPSLDKSFSDKFESKKYAEVDLISKFLASSDNEDERSATALSPSIKSDLFHRDKLFPSRQLLLRKEDGEMVRKEVKDEFEILKKKLAYSIDRGSWFSLFARTLGCMPQSSAHPSSFLKDVYGHDARSLLDRSISSTPTANSRSSTPINPRTNYDDDSSYADWETKADDAGDKQQDLPPVPLDKQRGWWRISDSEQLKSVILSLNVRGVREKNLQKFLEKNFNFICQSSLKPKRNIMKLEAADVEFVKNFTRAPQPDRADVWDFTVHRNIEMGVLGDIENLEEKVCNASLQGWRMSPRSSQDSSENLVGSFEKDLKSDEKYILDVARDKLLHLEHNIERRYLKPPLGRSNHLNLASLTSNKHSEDDDSDGDDEAATKELLSWRSAVNAATSTSQLSLYLNQLNKCIAWEKSIMKVSCQICCCDDNEAELLLCDMCDRGYHTYCIKPKLQSIPEGDWFCYECISKASGDMCCIACGKHGGRLVVCESCKRRAHSMCLDPPLNRVPKKWCCNPCLSEKLRPKKKHSNNKIGLSPSLSSLSPVSSSSSSAPCTQTLAPIGREFVEPVHGELNGEPPPPSNEEVEKTNHQPVHQQPQPPPPAEPPQPRCEKLKIDLKKRLQQEKALRSSNAEQGQVKSSNNVDHNQVANGADSLETDLSICHTVLSEMKKHQDAWPFLTPVSSKQFPTYRKVIRCPIDFQTISKRLKISHYKTREEFACDARLVFNNCEMFNEDDSTVGRAGHSMQDFFEKRWSELTNS